MRSPLLPEPINWELITSSSDNISGGDTLWPLTFSDSQARVEVAATPANPLLPSTIHITLADRPLLQGVTVTPLTVELPARQLKQLTINAPPDVAQTAVDVPLKVAVTVAATDNSDIPLSPPGLTLMVEDLGNASLPRNTFALTFTEGSYQTMVAVELTSRGLPGRIGLSVISDDITTTASVTLNPVPRVLASISLSAVSNSLVLAITSTTATAELILTALDNYGDPIEAGNIELQLAASNNAVVQTSVTVPIGISGIARQMIGIDLQNDPDTTISVQILRGTLDPAVQLLPDGGIQIEVRIRRILRQLQLSLADQVSPLRQIDRSLPIRANISLVGLDQYDQPIAFPEVMLTAAADPLTTQVALNPQRLSATVPEETVAVLVVMFPETLDTTVTITISDSIAGITTNNLVVRALPDRRSSLPSLNIDSEDPNITELDLIVALRYMSDQESSTASLTVNLTVTTADITATGRANLRQLFTGSGNLDRVDVNKDGRIDQLDLRILLRWLSGLRGTQLAEPEASEEIIQLLLEQP